MIDIRVYMELTKDERQVHLDLNSPCQYRGTTSYECRGHLAIMLDTSIPRNRLIHCCHACHDGRCSNWRHLYWGTARENLDDAIAVGVLGVGLQAQYGANNGNWQLSPWRNANQSKREDWALAGDIYDDLDKYSIDIGVHGYGYTYIMRRYGLHQGPARTMLIKFKKGWVPYEDPLWLEDFRS